MVPGPQNDPGPEAGGTNGYGVYSTIVKVM
jgi:hypothetical protein